jgi:protein SCO1/2
VNDQPKRLSLVVWVVVFLVAAILIAGSAVLFRSSERKSSDAMPSMGTVPDFHFITQEGKTLSRADLLGKVWVVDFIFTRCPGPCPIMTSRMAEVSRELTKADDVRLVSVSIDPENDTPAVLTEYAGRLQADPKRWIFLTGPKQEIRDFTMHGMMQAVGTDSSGILIHSTRFLVIDRDGQIRKMRNLDEPELVQKLLMDIGDLLRETHSIKESTTN